MLHHAGLGKRAGVFGEGYGQLRGRRGRYFPCITLVLCWMSLGGAGAWRKEEEEEVGEGRGRECWELTMFDQTHPQDHHALCSFRYCPFST
jgi:hypothetical protein